MQSLDERGAGRGKKGAVSSLMTRTLASLVAVAVALPGPSLVAAQAPSGAQAPSTAGAPATASVPFKQEELEQLVAPIALFPDALLAQVLMASTYPLEIVHAARWLQNSPQLTGKALEDALQGQPWDPSVKSLTAVPQVLAKMDERIDWTQKLGDAFLGQQAEVMRAVQALRAKAIAAGNLKSGKEQTVTTRQEGGETIVIIEPATTEVIYVPTYDPSYVYGAWAYPAYPPYYWYPPGYYYPGGAFLAGIIIGAWLWGGCNWGGGGGGVRVDHHRYNDFNRSNISDGNWKHNVEHRRGVAYRDDATASRYGRDFSRDAPGREPFRGRGEPGRADAQRGAFDGIGNSAATREISDRGNASRESMRSQGGFSGMRGGGGRGGGRR